MSWWDSATDLALTLLTETAIPAPGLDPITISVVAGTELASAAIDAAELVLHAVHTTGYEDATIKHQAMIADVAREGAKREKKALFDGVELGIKLGRAHR